MGNRERGVQYKAGERTVSAGEADGVNIVGRLGGVLRVVRGAVPDP